MTNSSLPSTLVKCLYLFFDLPILTNVNNDPDVGIDGGSGASVSGAGSSTRLYSPKERRLLLQKMFIQVLLKLCTYQPAVEELARKDDLTLLFSAVTSECPPHNVMWRKTAADILLTISRHSLNQPVVAYLHGKVQRIYKGLDGILSRSGSVKKFEFLLPFSMTTEKKNMFSIELKTKFVDNALQSFAFTPSVQFKPKFKC